MLCQSVEPSIAHHLITESKKLRDYLRENLQLSPGQIRFYQKFGCLYLNKSRIADFDLNVTKDDYLRLHRNPRRYSLKKVNWSERIIENNQNFLVVNKPAGLPTHPTLDNQIENVCSQLQAFLDTTLFVTHRLDVNTSGLLLIAKNQNFVKIANQWFENKQIKKHYLAKIEKGGNVKPGLYIDYMKKQKECPKIISRKNPGEWLECSLKINQVAEKSDHLLLDIELISGRTHQIRAQLASRFGPILGDQLYGSSLTAEGKPTSETIGQQNSRAIALSCYSLELPNQCSFHIEATTNLPK